MTTPSATMAFLHAHGLDVEPKGLTVALRAALEVVAARYRTEAGREGLTDAEVATARAGGLDVRPGWGDADPLMQGVVAHAALLQSGLTTREAAARLGVSDARIRQRLAERSLLAVREGRGWRLPLFQFAGTGELPGWSDVCRALPASASPVAVEHWLTLPHPDLGVGGGRTLLSPREWLIQGRSPAVVAALADELG